MYIHSNLQPAKDKAVSSLRTYCYIYPERYSKAYTHRIVPLLLLLLAASKVNRLSLVLVQPTFLPLM